MNRLALRISKNGYGYDLRIRPELLEDVAHALKDAGFKVRVIDLTAITPG